MIFFQMSSTIASIIIRNNYVMTEITFMASFIIVASPNKLPDKGTFLSVHKKGKKNVNIEF